MQSDNLVVACLLRKLGLLKSSKRHIRARLDFISDDFGQDTDSVSLAQLPHSIDVLVGELPFPLLSTLSDFIDLISYIHNILNKRVVEHLDPFF